MLKSFVRQFLRPNRKKPPSPARSGLKFDCGEGLST